MLTPAHRARLAAIFAVLVFLPALAAAAAPAEGTVARDAMRLLNANCLGCHNPEKHKGGLQMTRRDGLLKGSDSGPVLLEDKPAESLLLKVLAADADPHMPPKKQ